ncbi:MAG: CBS domain-containing protein [Acidimicrobiales bacterium]
MKIETLLASKGTAVATIQPGATVRDAVAELATHGVGALVVSTDGRQIDGICSERDIVRGLADSDGVLLDNEVSSIMSSTVYTCSLGDDTDSLMTVMTEHRIRHVPVVQDGALAGIVSIGDVVKTRIGELEKDRNELVDYINAR